MDKFKPHNPLVDSFMTVFIYYIMKKWRFEKKNIIYSI
jgi:hypothetical protein